MAMRLFSNMASLNSADARLDASFRLLTLIGEAELT
jgi:hypothetical protein